MENFCLDLMHAMLKFSSVFVVSLLSLSLSSSLFPSPITIHKANNDGKQLRWWRFELKKTGSVYLF